MAEPISDHDFKHLMLECLDKTLDELVEIGSYLQEGIGDPKCDAAFKKLAGLGIRLANIYDEVLVIVTNECMARKLNKIIEQHTKSACKES